MAVVFSTIQPKNIRTEADTPGGVTYHIIMPGVKVEKPICFRRIKKDPTGTLRCINPAGYDTWHLGTGACKFHGGANGAASSIKTGAHARIAKMRLSGTIDDYLHLDRDKLLNLDYELAASKAIFDEFMGEFPDMTDDAYFPALHRFMDIVNLLSNLIEKISRVETRNTLTAAQVLYLRATVADLFMKYIPEPMMREKAAKELAARIGGDNIEIEMRPSEVRLMRD